MTELTVKQKKIMDKWTKKMSEKYNKDPNVFEDKAEKMINKQIEFLPTDEKECDLMCQAVDAFCNILPENLKGRCRELANKAGKLQISPTEARKKLEEIVKDKDLLERAQKAANEVIKSTTEAE